MRIPFLGPDKKDKNKDSGQKPAPKQASKKKTPKKAAKKGKKAPKEKVPPPPKAPPPVGKTSGVGVNETWIQVFERNEEVDESERLTDEQISQFMKSEFPDLDTKLFDRVQIARGKYNRGGFHKKDKSGQVQKPKVRSRPHDAAAEDDGTGGRKLHPKETDVGPKQGPIGKFQKDFKSHKK